MRGDAEIIEILQQVAHIGITAISMGELLSGFKAGNKEKINRQELIQWTCSDRPITQDQNVEQRKTVTHKVMRNA